MRIRPFDYHSAGTLAQALEVLDLYGSEVKVLAGGTDLVVLLKEKKIAPSRLLNIQSVGEMDFVEEAGSTVRIGALARHADLAASPLLREKVPVLAEAVGMIGSVQIRNLGTIGGNLANASPAADSAGPLLALGARAVIAGGNGQEEVPLGDFFTGPGQTVLKPDQLLKEIVFDLPSRRSWGGYFKLTRRQGVDLALVSVAFQAELDRSGQRLGQVAIALGGVAPTPIRAKEAEKMLTGCSPEEAEERFSAAAQAAREATRPISDVRASADYRRAVIEAYVRCGAEKAVSSLLGKGGGK